MGGIVGCVMRRQFPHRLPGADIRPAIRHRHHRRARGALHHRVVDRFRRSARESVGAERDEAEIGARRRERGRDRGGAVRLEAVIFVEQEARAEHEIARVPQIALNQVSRGGLGVGLFDEPFDREQAGTQRRAGADVTVFGCRPRRLDAEHHDPILLGGGAGGGADFGECTRIGDDVVGGKGDDDGAIIARQRIAGAGGDRRAGIAPRRLEQDIGLGADGGKLLGNEELVLTVGHHDRPSKQARIGDPAHSFLEGRQRAEQRQELLGPVLARRRPQPRAGAAAHDQGDDRLSQFMPVARVRRYQTRAAMTPQSDRASFLNCCNFHNDEALSNRDIP